MKLALTGMTIRLGDRPEQLIIGGYSDQRQFNTGSERGVHIPNLTG